MFNHLKNLIGNIKYYYNIPKIGENEVGAFLTPKRAHFPKKFYNDMSNDLRHAYTSAILTRDKGAGMANTLGVLNEIVDYGASGREDTKRDLNANQWGRDYGIKYPNETNQELLNRIYQDYLKKYY